MRYTVDRIEEDLAVLEGEDRTMRTVPLSQLPQGIREGAVVTATEEGFTLDADADRAARIREKMRRLWK